MSPGFSFLPSLTPASVVLFGRLMVTLNSIYATAHIPYIRVTRPSSTIVHYPLKISWSAIRSDRAAAGKRGGGGLIIMVVVTDVSTASEKVILWVEWRVPFQSSIIGLIILLVTLVGNVKWIPCSYWPPKRTRWAPARDCPLWSRTKRENRIRGANLHSSKVLDNVGDGVAKRSSKKTTKHKWLL